MVLKFDEFISLNEGVSKYTVGEAEKLLPKFGWTLGRSSKGGDGYKIAKGSCVAYFHLRHDASSDQMRTLDIGGLDVIREYLIKEFQETGDLTLIKQIPWNRWGLKDPLQKELKDYDPETGKRIESEPKLNIGHKLQKAKAEKTIKDANEKYKDAQLIKISDECSIMMVVNEKGILVYNICRGDSDRRPLLKDWYDGRTNYKKVGSDHYFGKDNMRDLSTRFYKVLDDGTLDKVENIELRESKNIEKNLEML